ncbi:MAG TPA: lytic transglycosylase domain-containing protein [Paucimonas sp.]|nr:lytic transglycosylase domain-containing protein [Paucimonas sp.]
MVMVARDTASGFLTTMHHTVMVLGIAAIAAWGVLFVRPEIADHLKTLSPFAQVEEEETAIEEPSLANLMDMPGRAFAQPAAHTTGNGLAGNDALGTSRQQQWVTAWLAKRYRVATDATNMLVSAAYLTANEIKIDPLLILAVMAVESGFNPFAESPVGAQGLMQVMSKVHRDKFEELGGVKAALNPVANIRVGAQILKEYVRRGGSVEAGLKIYVGAADMETDFGYGARVLAEYRRLKDVSAGKKVPTFATSTNSVSAKPQQTEARPAAPVETEAMSTEPAQVSGKKEQELAALS